MRVPRSAHHLVILVASLTWAGPAVAQSLYTEGRSLEFRTDLPWADLVLKGDEEIKGVSPLRVPGPLEGQFWLTAEGEGVEFQRGRVKIHLDEEGSRIESYGGLPTGETLARSLVFPGFPQFRAQQKWKGLTMGVAGFLALSATLHSQREVWQARDDTDAAKIRFENETDPAEKDRLSTEIKTLREDQGFAEDRRSMALTTTAICWGVSMVDAVFFSPKFHATRVDASSLSLTMRPRARLDAGLRSAVFPGLGQHYNRQNTKAALISLGGLFVGSLILERQDEVNRATHELNKTRHRLDDEMDPNEVIRLTAEEQARQQDLMNEQDRRDSALRIGLIYWAANVLDAVIAFGTTWGTNEVPSGFGLGFDPHSRTLAARLQF